MDKKIAVFMCCYNHGKYVGEAIESILAQTYRNWELWIANDGSTDNSSEVISSYKDKRIHFYDSKENTAIAGVQDKLLEMIEGTEYDYIIKTDSDDKWRSDRLEKEVSILENHPCYGACASWDKVIFGEQTENDDYRGFTEYSHQKNDSRYSLLRKALTEGNFFNSCSVMVRRNVFREMGGYNQYFIRFADFRLFLNILLKYPIYIVEEPLVYYRRHETNISRNSKGRSIADWNELFFLYRDLFRKMSRKDFFNIFYGELIFEDSSEGAYEAAKIFLFCSLYGIRERTVFSQMAMECWYKYSGNPEAMRILKERYGLSNKFLNLLEASCGTPLIIPDIEDEPTMPVFETVFIKNFFDEKDGGSGIGRFICNPFYRLSLLIKKTNSDNETADLMMKEIYTARAYKLMEKTDRRIHIISGTDYRDRIQGIVDEFADEYKVYVSFVVKKSDYFTSFEEEEYVFKNANYVKLYDYKNCRLFFGKETGVEADIIYYVDCLGDDYETGDMVRRTNLEVTQMALIDEKKFKDRDELQALMLTIGNVDLL